MRMYIYDGTARPPGRKRQEEDPIRAVRLVGAPGSAKKLCVHEVRDKPSREVVIQWLLAVEPACHAAATVHTTYS